jgi:hypothetical protein
VKFEEESLHDFLEDPAEESLVVTDEEESKNSLRTSEKPSENNFGSDAEDEEQFMAAPTQLPTWAEKTLQDAGELVGDPADIRITVFWGSSSPGCHKKFAAHTLIYVTWFRSTVTL